MSRPYDVSVTPHARRRPRANRAPLWAVYVRKRGFVDAELRLRPEPVPLPLRMATELLDSLDGRAELWRKHS